MLALCEQCVVDRSEQSSVAEAPRELPLLVRAEEIDLPGPGAAARIRQAMVGDWHRREGSVRSPGLGK